MCLSETIKKSFHGNQSSISLSWCNLQVETSVWELKNDLDLNNNKLNKNTSFFFSLPKRRNKLLLPLLNGHFKLHTLNAVLGPSGAGKSTLLNVLSGNSSPCGGEITYHQNNSSPSSIVFIEQTAHETSLISDLTVGQTLHYAYCFKNGRSPTFTGSQSNFQTKLQEVLTQMLLPLDIVKRKVSQCSGGERRRVAIAQELMTEKKYPDFLFADEPTSGLDSQSALVVMQCLKRLAKDQLMTIVTSIHTPNDQTLALFDSLYILAKGGLCIYSGKKY